MKIIEKMKHILLLHHVQTDERGQEIEKNVTDQEQRYLKYMCKFENTIYIFFFYHIRF